MPDPTNLKDAIDGYAADNADAATKEADYTAKQRARDDALSALQGAQKKVSDDEGALLASIPADRLFAAGNGLAIEVVDQKVRLRPVEDPATIPLAPPPAPPVP